MKKINKTSGRHKCERMNGGRKRTKEAGRQRDKG